MRCGTGADIVNADLVDRVAEDCELVSRRLSRDPYTGAEAQHESEVEPDSLTVGRTTVATFQVGRRFSGAADNIGFAVSRDDGRTWRSGLLPGLTRASVPAGANERASDPVVAYDAVESRLADRDARTGRADHATDRQSLDRRPQLGRPVTAIEGILGERHHLRQELDRVRQRPLQPPPRPVLPRLHGHAPLRPAGGDHVDRRRRDVVAPVGIPVTDAVGAFPVIRQSGELVVVYLWSGSRLGSSVSSTAQ